MLLEDYKKINNSFKKHCVYRIGNEAGFFSEINKKETNEENLDKEDVEEANEMIEEGQKENSDR